MNVKEGDKVLGPHKVTNANGKEVVMTVKAVDVLPDETKKDGVRRINCSYVLNDAEHVETFREDSLRAVA